MAIKKAADGKMRLPHHLPSAMCGASQIEDILDFIKRQRMMEMK